MWLDLISLSLSCVSTEIHETSERGTQQISWSAGGFFGSIFQWLFLYIKSNTTQTCFLRWRTHKLTWLQFFTLGSKMRPEYAKSTPPHTCFASVPSNNLHLSSYMMLLGGRLCQFESLRQRRELDPECLFHGWMFECLWSLHFPSAATGKKAPIGCEVVSACARPYRILEDKCLFFYICVRFREEIKISWGWGSHGDLLKQNFRTLENVKINQGETSWS